MYISIENPSLCEEEIFIRLSPREIWKRGETLDLNLTPYVRNFEAIVERTI